MQLEDLQVVLKVAEFRSITAAATNLDMLTATASAAVKRVEQTLGVELFIRTTRHLRLSNAGERYLPHCQQALLMLEQAEQHMKNELDIVDGELRIALPSDLGRNIVEPWLDEFMSVHQGVSIAAHLTDSNIDFYRDNIDIALRYGSPKDSSLYGFKICHIPRILCASPTYIAQHGMPKNLNDLSNHNGLFYQLHDKIYDIWEFSHQGNNSKVKMHSNRTTNDGDMVRRWCVAGKGLATKSCLDVSNDMLSGKLVPVLSEFIPVDTELWLICPSKQSITPAVRLLRDMIKEKCQEVLKQLTDKGVIKENKKDI